MEGVLRGAGGRYSVLCNMGLEGACRLRRCSTGCVSPRLPAGGALFPTTPAALESVACMCTEASDGASPTAVGRAVARDGPSHRVLTGAAAWHLSGVPCPVHPSAVSECKRPMRLRRERTRWRIWRYMECGDVFSCCSCVRRLPGTGYRPGWRGNVGCRRPFDWDPMGSGLGCRSGF